MMMTSGVTRASGVCCNRQTTRRVVTRATANTKEHKVRTANAVRYGETEGKKKGDKTSLVCLLPTSFLFDPSLSLARARHGCGSLSLCLSLSLSLSLCLSIFFLSSLT